MSLAAAQVRPVFKPSWFAAFALYSLTALADEPPQKVDPFLHHLYLGGSAGYGSTTWQGLVPSAEKQNIAISMSTPISTSEGGGVFGAFMGYEFTPYFALEANYMHFPNATLLFDETSLFAFDHDDNTTMLTRTEMLSFIAKIMLIVPNTRVRAYSNFGIADIHRDDDLKDHWQVAPTFGFGLNYNITPRIMAELAANYAAGYGESEINPVDDYIPFLYSVSFKLAYRMF